MKCRDQCGACCIAPSISSPLPGMPEGKPAGVRCIHLTADYRCAIYMDPARPGVCRNFMADREFCGETRKEAMLLLNALEQEKDP